MKLDLPTSLPRKEKKKKKKRTKKNLLLCVFEITLPEITIKKLRFPILNPPSDVAMMKRYNLD